MTRFLGTSFTRHHDKRVQSLLSQEKGKVSVCCDLEALFPGTTSLPKSMRKILWLYYRNQVRDKISRTWAGDVAELVKGLPSLHQALVRHKIRCPETHLESQHSQDGDKDENRGAVQSPLAAQPGLHET